MIILGSLNIKHKMKSLLIVMIVVLSCTLTYSQSNKSYKVTTAEYPEGTNVVDNTKTRAFCIDLKLAILNNNKSWILDHIAFPYFYSVSSKKTIEIKNKSEFEKYYTSILNATFIKQIQKTDFNDLSFTGKGAMIDSGIIWFDVIDGGIKVMAFNTMD